MLRMLLIYLSQAGWARAIVQRWGIAKRTAARFVAGENLEDAVAVVKDLADRGISSTLDHLGENVTTREEATAAADEILVIIERLTREAVRSGISVKLSQIGLVLDPDLCRENMLRILEKARQEGIFVRIDMEDSKLTQATIDLYREVRDQGYSAYTGIVIQASLYRSREDIEQLLREGSKIRLCKGAYKEPRSVAYPRKKDVDGNFDQLTRKLLDSSREAGSSASMDGAIPPIPAVATHDQIRIAEAREYAETIGLPKRGLEFQMLHGIRGDLQNSLVAEGYPVRVYVPYGQEWYPYFVRRLAERPANLWFFISNLFRS
ncbi:MAG: proline dehydrogenase family protein [Anaerolineales bacterium]